MDEITPLCPTVQAQGAWASGLSTGPVFIDGLTHSLFYLIVAAKNSAESYQAVVVGKFNSDWFKVKFYGRFSDWGFNTASLADKFRAQGFLDRSDERAGYQRYMTDRQGVDLILAALLQTRNTTVAPVENVMDAFEVPHRVRKAITDRAQPNRIGHVKPVLPFTHIELLEVDDLDTEGN